MSKIQIANTTKGSNRLTIADDASTSKITNRLKLFPGGNQTVLVTIDTSVFKSSDYGSTFTYQSSYPSGFFIQNFEISKNNLHYTIIEETNYTTGGTYRKLHNSTNKGLSWSYDISLNTLGTPSGSLSGSNDGKYLLMSGAPYNNNGNLMVSNDFGKTATTVATGAYIRLRVDSIGKNMLAGGIAQSAIYSSDYGVTWGSPPISFGNIIYSTISENGNRIVVVGYTSKSIFVGDGNWSNWVTSNLGTSLIHASVSYDGKYIIAPGGNDSGSSPYIHISNDYGATFTPYDTGYSQRWWSSAMSSDGKYMFALGGRNLSTRCFKSIDYGETWSLVEELPLALYQDVAMSKSGQYTYVTATDQGMYVSKDYMNSWTQLYTGRDGWGVITNF